jgi:hypothetical protein
MLIELFFFLTTSFQQVEENQAYLGCRANRQIKIDKRLAKDRFRGVGAPEISVTPPQLYPQVAAEEARESGTPSPTRVSPHLGMPR